ncbi:family 20 glycosylhydrolase [Georgenia faecalis]|uniref:beta-N-acetylhexosaminidase n=1 Tax=Georgenia faecalis TaxID=2483799 RepID=A0ABV9D7L0_9MICO|nr:family 20 glycosylhydrolase [Georgenia faecalis]
MPAIVPAPAHHEPSGAAPFVLGPDVRIVVPDGDDAVLAVAEHLAALLAPSAVGEPRVVTGDDDGPGAVVLRGTARDGARAEAYEITVSAHRVELAAAGALGLFRAATTLAQLTEGGTVAAGRVADAPRYAWRGLSIDVVRHWFPPAVLREVVDLMASYKLNVLHLHLTDDQGWRLEIASRPRLTAVSGRTQVGGEEAGFLTAQDYAELVAYAAARHVLVVPEIDVPGHTNAALHAYGELTPSGEPTDAYLGIEVGHSQISLNEPATAGFLRDVFADVAALTPGRYVHMGGDEVRTMDPAEYREFVTEASRVVADTGKLPVVWQEAAVADLPDGALVQLWDPGMSTAPILAAAERGHDVILSPAKHVYLDMKYARGDRLGLDWAGTVELDGAYDWDPDDYVPGLDPARVRGVEAAAWTETLTTREELFTMLLPRLAAVAEVAWTPQEARSIDSLRMRLPAHAERWAAADLAYHASPGVDWPR